MACCAIWKKGEKLKNSNGEIKKTTNLCNADIHQFNIEKKNEWKIIQWRKCVYILLNKIKIKINFKILVVLKSFFFHFQITDHHHQCVWLFVCIFQYMSFTCQFIRLKLGRQHSNMHINCVFSIHPQLNFFLWTF